MTTPYGIWLSLKARQLFIPCIVILRVLMNEMNIGDKRPVFGIRAGIR